MYAKEVMSTDVVTVADTATVFEAAALLVGAHASAAAVLDDDDFMVGIVTEADLLGRVEDDCRTATALDAAKSLHVSDIMSRGVIAARETATLDELARLMMTHGIKCIPIVRDRLLLGMVSRADLLKVLITGGARAYG